MTIDELTTLVADLIHPLRPDATLTCQPSVLRPSMHALILRSNSAYSSVDPIHLGPMHSTHGRSIDEWPGFLAERLIVLLANEEMKYLDSQFRRHP